MNFAAITRRIRRCESEVPAQLVLEYAIKDAVEAACTAMRNELNSAEPVCWITPGRGSGWRMRFDPPTTDTELGWTPLYDHSPAPNAETTERDALRAALERIVHYYDLAKSGSSLPPLTTQHEMFDRARKVLNHGR